MVYIIHKRMIWILNDDRKFNRLFDSCLTMAFGCSIALILGVVNCVLPAKPMTDRIKAEGGFVLTVNAAIKRVEREPAHYPEVTEQRA